MHFLGAKNFLGENLMKKFLKVGGLFLLFQIIYVPILCICLVFYGPFTNVRDMIVTTAMTTMTHQYFATWFLSDEKIDEILKANRPEENIEEQEVEEIQIDENLEERMLHTGASIINVSGGKKTAEIVRELRKISPNFPIIATGGPTVETIQEVIDAGANAITYTPPTNGDIFKLMMEKYRHSCHRD